MDITTGLDFAAPPADVYTMMTDQSYLDEVCVASHSIRYETSVDGDTTHASRTLPAPEAAARFTGPELVILEDIVWSAAAADGSRTGTMTMTVKGQPVALKGRLTLAPGGRGTKVDLVGDLKVNVPFLGRKLEQSSAPAVLAGFRTQQQVGDRWLTR